jgi:hypothetical protein
MPSFRVNVKSEHKGMVFKVAPSKAAAQRMVIAINEAIAQEGVNRVRARLGEVLQNPTGYYESRIAVERRQIYRGVWDQNVIYGPWLEGTGSRNRTTRFKGYRTFRTVKQALDQDSRTISQPLVEQYVREMNQ